MFTDKADRPMVDIEWSGGKNEGLQSSDIGRKKIAVDA